MFHIYEIFLIVSGVAMLVMAGIGGRRAKVLRIWNGILGAAFTGYGLYLLLFFKGGHYFLFYYVFILPILMIVRFFRDRSRHNATYPKLILLSACRCLALWLLAGMIAAYDAECWGGCR